jgi:hypothetical protein
MKWSRWDLKRTREKYRNCNLRQSKESKIKRRSPEQDQKLFGKYQNQRKNVKRKFRPGKREREIQKEQNKETKFNKNTDEESEVEESVHKADKEVQRDKGIGTESEEVRIPGLGMDPVMGDISSMRSLINNLTIKKFEFTDEEWNTIMENTEYEVCMADDPYYFEEERLIKMNDERGARCMRSPCFLPLEKISENRIDLKAFEKLPIKPSHTTKDAWSWIQSDRILKHMYGYKQEKKKVSRSMMDDLFMLRECGVLTNVELSEQISHLVRLFKVPKKNGLSRLIADCRDINNLLPKPGDMCLPNIHNIIDSVLEHKWVIQFDGKNFFYQFGLSGGAEKAFPVGIGNKRGKFEKYFLNVLPMGFKYAPIIAQHTANLIVENVLHITGGVGFAWVDNFIFCADTEEQAIEMGRVFKEIAKIVNMEIKEEGKATQKTEILGIHFDLVENRISPTETQLGILKDRKQSLKKGISIRRTVGAIGVALWCLYVISRAPLALYNEVLESLSQIGKCMFDKAEAWDNTLPEKFYHFIPYIEGVLDDAMRSKYCKPVDNGDNSGFIWTDASELAVGVVLEANGRSVGWSYGRERKIPIFANELLTGVESLVSIKQKYLIMDNTSAVRALYKGHSKSRGGNVILKKFVQSWGSGQVHVAWVPTLAQRADDLSRNHFECTGHMDIAPLLKQVRWVTK